MNRRMIILAVLGVSILCVAGFNQNSNWQYRVVECVKTDTDTIQNAINNNTKGKWENWEFHSTMVLPADSNHITARCQLIFRKNR